MQITHEINEPNVMPFKKRVKLLIDEFNVTNDNKYVMLMHDLLQLLPYTKTSNGETDSTKQILCYFVNGDLIGKSQNGVTQFTPVFYHLVNNSLFANVK